MLIKISREIAEDLKAILEVAQGEAEEQIEGSGEEVFGIEFWLDSDDDVQMNLLRLQGSGKGPQNANLLECRVEDDYANDPELSNPTV